MALNEKRIYIAGSGGMVGNAIVQNLRSKSYSNLIERTSGELDLIDQVATQSFFSEAQPEVVIIAAAKVGGILANNTFRAEFLYNNLMIEANVIDAAYRSGVEKLIFLGSSCIYPRGATQPMREEELLTGPLESTNEPYAIAKIAGIKLCENYYRQYGANFFSVMPTNLYGPNDNFDLTTSHVIPALIRKFHDAKTEKLEEVTVWGTGRPHREFMFVEDLADAVVFLMENTDAASVYGAGISHINIGCGDDVAIRELAEMVRLIVGYEGRIVYDMEKPDGVPRKLLDSSRLAKMGWRSKTSLAQGLERTYGWFLASEAAAEAHSA